MLSLLIETFTYSLCGFTSLVNILLKSSLTMQGAVIWRSALCMWSAAVSPMSSTSPSGFNSVMRTPFDGASCLHSHGYYRQEKLQHY